jgi:hypothetical protein
MITIERHDWQPSFKNEIWIIDKRRDHSFTITLKQEEEVEIEFEWDYGWGGRGSERMTIPIQQLKDLLNEITN